MGPDEHASGGFVVGQLFADGRGPITALLWVMFFMNLLNLYFLNSWLPTVMNDIGIKVETAILITTLFQIGGAIGAIGLGRIIDRRACSSAFRILAWTRSDLRRSAIFLIGQSGRRRSARLLVITVFAAGFGIVGGQTSSNALAAEFYRPRCDRPVSAGRLVSAGSDRLSARRSAESCCHRRRRQTRQIFWFAAVPALVATCAVPGSLAAGPQRRPRMSASS